MADKIEILHGSLVQHGTVNDRVYVLKVNTEQVQELINDIKRLAKKNSYGKIIVKTPASVKEHFAMRKFREEAHIPHFFKSGEDLFFMTMCLKSERAMEPGMSKLNRILETALEKSEDPAPDTVKGFEFRKCTPEESPDIAELLSHVFKSYPFPVDKPAYIQKTMETTNIYFGAWKENQLVGISSAEIDPANKSAEMTDFATHPEHRGLGIAGVLLNHMEKEIKANGYSTAYTIARAESFGMNIAFARNGYQYGGRLIKSTQISGGFESMNIWHKAI